jgi:hypothetical protein
MNNKDEFSKWIASVEEALSSESVPIEEELLEQGSCGDCGTWDCPACFPDAEGDLAGIEGQQIPAIIVIPNPGNAQSQEPHANQQGIGMAGTHPVDGDTFDHNEDDEIDITTMGDDAFSEDSEDYTEPQDTKPRSGNGIKLGHIVQKFVKADTEEHDSPLSYGSNLEEDNFDDESYNDAAPIARQNYQDEMSQIEPEEAMEIIGKILSMQSMGLSKSDRPYTEEQLSQLSAVKLKQVQQQVIGSVDEAGEPKPTKTKTRSPLDDFETLDFSNSGPLATYTNSSDDSDNTATATPSMPTASAASTRAKTGSMTPTQNMRDMMNRISPDAGGDEPELANNPVNQSNTLVATSAGDVPAVISSAMQATGTQVPEWHTVNNLPGYQQQNVRGMGRQIFSMFTRTPLEQIQTIANVDGQGPNTDAELRAVASWLHHNADDLGKVELSHGRAIPGYKPDVKEYSLNGVRFHVVIDTMGQYIYAYPDADATTNNGIGQIGRQLSIMPQLHEEGNMTVKLTITEAIKLDDIIRDGLKSISENIELDESSLSKLIGKQKGGQKLVQWLHRKHKLGNEADLQPHPFSERIMAKEFKSHPDNFIIVSASNGVAGVKPYEKMIRDRMEAARKKGKDYNPGGDSTLQYQIIAFTDDGQQVDPALLQPVREPGEEREVDPTVMKARMGKINGRDTLNSDNIFELLSAQIGGLRTVYLASKGVERDKIQKRTDMNKPDADMAENDAVDVIFKKIRPVLKTLANQALSTINNRAKRFIDGGNFEGAQKIAASGTKLKQFLATIDTSGDVNTVYGDFSRQLKKALADASGASQYSDAYKQYLSAAARGNSAALKPVLDAMRDNLVGLQ